MSYYLEQQQYSLDFVYQTIPPICFITSVMITINPPTDPIMLFVINVDGINCLPSGDRLTFLSTT